MNEEQIGYVVVSVRDLQALLLRAKKSAYAAHPGQSLASNKVRNHCLALDLEIKPDCKGRLQVQIPVRYTHSVAD